MRLIKIHIRNFRSIIDDEVIFHDFTFFVGKNNYGKSNYLKAIDSLLSFAKTYSNVKELRNRSNEPIVIEGFFEGIKEYTPQLKDSRHKDAVEKLIDNDQLIRLRLTIDKDGNAETLLVNPQTKQTENPTGWSSNCRKLLPESIFVPATAETADELQEKSSTALSKIKRELMEQFFASLSTQIESAFGPINKYLHGESTERAKELIELENDFAEEMMGEFSRVKPSLHFSLPDSNMVGKGMKIKLDDGFHDCEIEQKGNGLQRTALFALMRLLSKHYVKDKNKPSPIFLIEDLEAFLHPSAQMRLAESIELMSSKYQTVATTHSPFVLSEKLLLGYRRVCRDEKNGSKTFGPAKHTEELKKQDYTLVKNCLVHSGNLISLFSDIIIIVEGSKDIGFYSAVLNLFQIQGADRVSFVRSVGGGNSNIHVSFKFFKLMGLEKVYAISDLDCLFDRNFKEMLKTINIDSTFIEDFRKEIGYNDQGQPGLDFIRDNISKLDAKKLDLIIQDLEKGGIYILSKGSPEDYYSSNFKKKYSGRNVKEIWQFLEKKDELTYVEELERIFTGILKK